VAAILAELGRGQQAQVAALAAPSPAVEALLQLDPARRDALLAELSETDRARLKALLNGGDTP
jgi:Mg/Co/Ni transporter MgtE